jgi:hypothetical protein
MGSVNYDGLPEHMREGARLYVEQGVEPGDFMVAVLTNNLMLSFSRADRINIRAMDAWCDWLWNECPGNAWGSPEKVTAWIESGGMATRATAGTMGG